MVPAQVAQSNVYSLSLNMPDIAIETDNDNDTDTDTDADNENEVANHFFNEVFEVARPAAVTPIPVLRGGGTVTTRTFNINAIEKYHLAYFTEELSTFAQYDFVAYMDDTSISALNARHSVLFGCRLPLDVLAPRLSMIEVRQVAEIHDISIGSRAGRDQVADIFKGHHCGKCDQYSAVLVPHGVAIETVQFVFRSDDFERVRNTIKPFLYEEMLPYLRSENDQKPYMSGGEVIDLVQGDTVARVDHSEIVSSSVPWAKLATKGSKAVAQLIAKIHMLDIAPRASKAIYVNAISAHRCSLCSPFCIVFRPRSSIRKCARPVPVPHSASPSFVHLDLTCLSEETVDEGVFPPPPLTLAEMADIGKEVSDAFNPSNIEESGCAVCGQLTLRRDLTPLAGLDLPLDILREKGVCRHARLCMRDPVVYEDGPILDSSVKDICPACLRSLRDGKRPSNALANGFWLGDVPKVLKELTFAEQMLVARVRHNRCVLRVSSGHTKMIANVISFENPTPKVYKFLPPPREELSHVLAFVFTGIQPPSEEDLDRTPMLVRRNHVYAALTWLQMNHADYRDLIISDKNLSDYDERGIPVKVIFRRDQTGSNVPASAMSVHEMDDEIGVDSGECPFQVNGLTGSKLLTMSYEAKKLTAMRHLKEGGHVLGIGQAEEPQSLYDNPQLYPQMFPWLFPYGLGGLGLPMHSGLISELRHKRALLMYHDKRFQTDSHFVMVAFNHHQLKCSTSGSFIMTKRSNFSTIARELRDINGTVLKNMADKLQKSMRYVPEMEAERQCYSLLDRIDIVNGRVPGSITNKKYMRKELWSLVSFKGSPSWFITVSPVDTRHPLCFYWANTDTEFKPVIRRSHSEIFRAVVKNPVAGARFFHFLVELLIHTLLRWKDERPGVYGKPAAYYGVVEQQGRTALHLHMLIWIMCALSPAEVKKRLLSDDSEFQKKLLQYIESCQMGEFFSGKLTELKEAKKTGKSFKADCIGQLPRGPDLQYQGCESGINIEECGCGRCATSRDWFEKYKTRVDSVLLASNVHTCYLQKDVVDPSGVFRCHLTGKGCINKDMVCSARFPRELFLKSTVDEDGHINIKKTEGRINTVQPMIAWTFGCNTDSTSLNSGTAVNGTVGYVAEYLTKMGLKTYQIFSAAYDVFERNTDLVEDIHKPDEGEKASRKLILRMVNSLTSKMEIGGPMAAMYLLGNPDRYSSHIFVPFYWLSYVQKVQADWDDLLQAFCYDSGTSKTSLTSSYDPSVDIAGDHSEGEDNDTARVVVGRSGSRFVTQSVVDDYRFRPDLVDSVCLYDWIQCSVKERRYNRGEEVKGVLPFSIDHPCHSTHGVRFNVERKDTIVPNFIGRALPRRDSEDKDFYACTMLTLFKPWRSGMDLRSSDKSWAETFDMTDFGKRYETLMAHFHVRYECYDGKDDYHNQLKIRIGKAQTDDDPTDTIDEAEMFDDLAEGESLLTEIVGEDLDNSVGEWTHKKLKQMNDVSLLFQSAGWQINDCDLSRDDHSEGAFRPETDFSGSKWKEIVQAERKRILNARLAAIKDRQMLQDDMDIDGTVDEVGLASDVQVLPPQYFSSSFRSTMDVQSAIDGIVTEFSLNTEQERAYRIIANRSLCVGEDPLRMYIGGMGGTGKTQVIRALQSWFAMRNESYRLVVLAPTGAAASLVNGSTYHSYLGINTGDRKATQDRSSTSLEHARQRMAGVDYVFMDEISMIGCQDFSLIDLRLKLITGVEDVAFGGINMVVAGDFAQLPPAKDVPLYSGEVSKTQSARQSSSDQEKTLGLLLWHQFLTVVILRKNMRQTSDSEMDIRFRQVLNNLRYKDCTNADVEFLRTRIPSYNSSLNLNDERWRNVSVITAWNSYKDQINEMNAVRYALENNRTLHRFYSVDKYGGSRGSGKSAKTSKRSIPRSTSVQKVLWRSAPHTSDHIAGCLPLCVGMPIMIRYNEATELCITKGQEARVVGWTSSEIEGYPEHRALDTLFVELINPPKTIRLPHLNDNIVPLVKMTTSIQAVLPNDRKLTISRQQVPVLLNFSMTDYSSQGKTRKVNVVDLSKLRNHQAIYTALSRGTSAQDTIIVQDFKSGKVQGGLSGYLRQEFRELDILDELTLMRYEGGLPDNIMRNTRESTMRAFKAWKSLQRASSSGIGTAKHSVHEKRKSSMSDVIDTFARKRARLDNTLAPVNDRGLLGLIWDSADHSCAYDATFSILKALWDRDQIRWTETFSSYSVYLNLLAMKLPHIGIRLSFEQLRDEIRCRLQAIDSVSFPSGTHGMDLIRLLEYLLGHPISFGNEYSSQGVEAGLRLRGPFLTVDPRYSSIDSYFTSGHWLSNGVDNVRHSAGNSLLVLSIGADTLITQTCYVGCNVISLVGIIYWEGAHFTCRVISVSGESYRNDGVLNGALFVPEGSLSPDQLYRCGDGVAVALFYQVDTT